MDFPKKQVEDAIRDEIRLATEARPTARAGWESGVDSLVVVEATLRVEEEFGIELPDEVMPPGGYDDAETCVRHLTDRCAKIWIEKRKEREGATG